MKQITIKGQKYKFRVINSKEGRWKNLFGLCESDLKIITINIHHAKTKELFLKTCIHEIFHGYIAECHLSDILGEKIEESLACLVESFIDFPKDRLNDLWENSAKDIPLEKPKTKKKKKS